MPMPAKREREKECEAGKATEERDPSRVKESQDKMMVDTVRDGGGRSE